jgi:hypothetical protein
MASSKPQAGQRKIPVAGFAYDGWTIPHSDTASSTAIRKQMNLPFDLLLAWIIR